MWSEVYESSSISADLRVRPDGTPPALTQPVLAVLLATLSVGATPAELRCVARISEALVGYGPSRTVEPTDREGLVESLLQSPDFVKGFAGFINARFNPVMGDRPYDDAVYYAAKYVLENGRPWHEIYTGRFGWVGPNYTQFLEDPAGLGYLGSPAWQKRYAGNDHDGFMLIAAYRLLHNLTGIVLVPSPFNGEDSATVEGRSAQPCRQCHFDSPFALDKIAQLLPKRQGNGNRVQLLPPVGGSVELLDGRSYSDLRQVVERLIDSDDHRFWTCRTVFEFVYGRPENACEAPVFDACVDAYLARGDIRDALRAVVLDPGFCEAQP